MFFIRPKARPTVHAKSQRVGLDVTASRMRAIVSGPTERPLLLDSPDVDLRLVLALDRKPIGIGRCGTSLLRKSPHLTCSNYLSAIGTDKVWKVGRAPLSADGAVGTSFARVAEQLASEAEAVTMAVPGYLTVPQVASLSLAATVHKLPVVGTMSGPMAIAVDRAVMILNGGPSVNDHDEHSADIVPIGSSADGPGSAVVIDADDSSLNATVIWVDRDVVRVLGSASWPKLSAMVWTDRLIDAISEKCVRLCRRDPRDSAEAEQSLYEQLDRALDGLSLNRPMSFHLRAAHWVQDLVQQPSDFDAACAGLVNTAISNLTDLIYTSGVPAPPRAIWLTHAASRLPGLLASVYEHSAESTDVSALPADAVASAVAKLTPRWLSGELPRQHLDTICPLVHATRALSSIEKARIG